MADPKLKTVSEQLLETLRAAHERSRRGYNITDELARAVTEAEALLAVPELGTCDGEHGGPRCADPECWNDSEPASDPLKDHQIAAVVNKVCRLAREFHNHDSLRQRIAQELVPALKQQATPEPVGEVVAWQRRDRNIVTGEWSAWREDDDIEEVLDPEWAERRPLFTRPAPGVPDAEDLRDRLVAISSAVADSDDRAAQSMLSETLRLLAAAQAKGGAA